MNSPRSIHTACPAAFASHAAESRTCIRLARLALTIAVLLVCLPGAAQAARLSAGAAKVDITNVEAGPVNDPLYVKALVLRDDATTAVIITVDAVAKALSLSVEDAWRPAVRANLEVSLRLGRLVDEFKLPDEAESASVYSA